MVRPFSPENGDIRTPEIIADNSNIIANNNNSSEIQPDVVPRAIPDAQDPANKSTDEEFRVERNASSMSSSSCGWLKISMHFILNIVISLVLLFIRGWLIYVLIFEDNFVWEGCSLLAAMWILPALATLCSLKGQFGSVVDLGWSRWCLIFFLHPLVISVSHLYVVLHSNLHVHLDNGSSLIKNLSKEMLDKLKKWEKNALCVAYVSERVQGSLSSPLYLAFNVYLSVRGAIELPWFSTKTFRDEYGNEAELQYLLLIGAAVSVLSIVYSACKFIYEDEDVFPVLKLHKSDVVFTVSSMALGVASWALAFAYIKILPVICVVLAFLVEWGLIAYRTRGQYEDDSERLFGTLGNALLSTFSPVMFLKSGDDDLEKNKKNNSGSRFFVGMTKNCFLIGMDAVVFSLVTNSFMFYNPSIIVSYDRLYATFLTFEIPLFSYAFLMNLKVFGHFMIWLFKFARSKKSFAPESNSEAEGSSARNLSEPANLRVRDTNGNELENLEMTAISSKSDQGETDLEILGENSRLLPVNNNELEAKLPNSASQIELEKTDSIADENASEISSSPGKASPAEQEVVERGLSISVANGSNYPANEESKGNIDEDKCCRISHFCPPRKQNVWRCTIGFARWSVPVLLWSVLVALCVAQFYVGSSPEVYGRFQIINDLGPDTTYEEYELLRLRIQNYHVWQSVNRTLEGVVVWKCNEPRDLHDKILVLDEENCGETLDKILDRLRNAPDVAPRAILRIDNKDVDRPSSPVPNNMRDLAFPIFVVRKNDKNLVTGKFEELAIFSRQDLRKEFGKSQKNCYSCTYNGKECKGFSAVRDDDCEKGEHFLDFIDKQLSKVANMPQEGAELCTWGGNYCQRMNNSWSKVDYLIRNYTDQVKQLRQEIGRDRPDIFAKVRQLYLEFTKSPVTKSLLEGLYQKEKMFIESNGLRDLVAAGNVQFIKADPDHWRNGKEAIILYLSADFSLETMLEAWDKSKMEVSNFAEVIVFTEEDVLLLNRLKKLLKEPSQYNSTKFGVFFVDHKDAGPPYAYINYCERSRGKCHRLNGISDPMDLEARSKSHEIRWRNIKSEECSYFFVESEANSAWMLEAELPRLDPGQFRMPYTKDKVLRIRYKCIIDDRNVAAISLSTWIVFPSLVSSCISSNSTDGPIDCRSQCFENNNVTLGFPARWDFQTSSNDFVPDYNSSSICQTGSGAWTCDPHPSGDPDIDYCHLDCTPGYKATGFALAGNAKEKERVATSRCDKTVAVVFGLSKLNGRYESDIEVYSEDGRCDHKLPSLPEALANATVFFVRGTFWACGGFDANAGFEERGYCYNYTVQGWKLVFNSNMALICNSSVTVMDFTYCIATVFGDTPSNQAGGSRISVVQFNEFSLIRQVWQPSNLDDIAGRAYECSLPFPNKTMAVIVMDKEQYVLRVADITTSRWRDSAYKLPADRVPFHCSWMDKDTIGIVSRVRGNVLKELLVFKVKSMRWEKPVSFPVEEEIVGFELLGVRPLLFGKKRVYELRLMHQGWSPFEMPRTYIVNSREFQTVLSVPESYFPQCLR